MGQPKGFPPLYKWMLAPDLMAAHWLRAKVNGNELVEPLNVVFVDRRSKSMEEARVDEPFELPNDHDRVFGPVSLDGHLVFVAALSREGVAPLDKVKHRYVSFTRAWDAVIDGACLPL
jgi:hypothetical protein